MRVHPDFYKVISKIKYLHIENGRKTSDVRLTKEISEEIKQNAQRFV